MKLEQFKEIADENLRDLYVDERMVSRIHRKLCAVPVRRKARVPRASALLAAACVERACCSPRPPLRPAPRPPCPTTAP